MPVKIETNSWISIFDIFSAGKMQTFQITCINVEPIVFEDIEEPDPMCLFEYIDNKKNPSPISPIGPIGPIRPIRPSLFQPFGAYYNQEIALGTDEDTTYVFTFVDGKWERTQWMVSAFIRFSAGYNDGVEYTNLTLAKRKNVDHDLFLNPHGLLPKLGVFDIIEYAFIYGVLDTIKYNFNGLPSVLELQNIVTDNMRLFVSGIQFQANSDTDTTLFDFIGISDDTMEFQPSLSQPLKIDNEHNDNITIRLSGHSLLLNDNVVIMYEGTSDYNSGVLRSRLLSIDGLTTRILDVIQQPTLYRLGIAAGLAYRGLLLQGMPTIRELTDILDREGPNSIEEDREDEQKW